MNSRVATKPVKSLAILWAFSLFVWGGTASVAQSYDAAQQDPIMSSTRLNVTNRESASRTRSHPIGESLFKR